MKITKISNGYIIDQFDGSDRKECYHELIDVFNRMLLFYEGRSTTFDGDSYGHVEIIRGKLPENFSLSEKIGLTENE